MFIKDEGGYTSIATAVALLVSVSLVFCVASVEWVLARDEEVQQVADAAALAGSNAVAAFCSVAQVVDACVLSMGLVGLVTLGAGLVIAAIPGAQVASEQALEAGAKILRARRKFARSAWSGLQKLERALPFLVVANAASCVRANSQNGLSYVGAAMPYPLESHSDYGSLAEDVTGDEVTEAAERLEEATRRVEEAKKRADALRERAWRADCVDDPRCMRSRAASLAGLPDALNPYVDTPDAWDFGIAILRSRAYYAERLALDAPEAGDIESVTDSLVRREFYDYALEEVNGAWYSEESDGHVSLYLPHLARNSQEVRATRLYTDAIWPCTEDEDGVTLHSTLECPGATGTYVGTGAVCEIESGAVRRCDVCRMDVGDLGSVAAISTTANNGYEHYWQIVVEAAAEYEGARNEQADAEAEAREAADEGQSVFEEALEQLAAPRPKIMPPGAWGCVGVVMRKGGIATPTELTSAFMEGTELPRGVAVSASALAWDDATDGNDILSRLLSGVTQDARPLHVGLLAGITGLWGRVLVAYGSAFEGVGGAASNFLDGIDGIFGGTVGAWLKSRVASLVQAAGLQPADMRAKKPVIVGTDTVLRRAGANRLASVRTLLQALPSGGDATQVARALGVWVWDQWGSRRFTVAELPIPGTGVSVPLTIDLGALGGAS